MSPAGRWPLAEMPRLTAPIWLGHECYACNAQGLHVPISTLTLEQIRCAVCYLALARQPLEAKP